MRRRDEDRQSPRDLAGEDLWPDVPPDAPPELVAISTLARRLEASLQSRSQREVATKAGISHTTVGRILAGQSWSNLRDLGRLEAALGTRLWPAATRGRRSLSAVKR